jgi:ASC-1-like (ASCH) protein
MDHVAIMNKKKKFLEKIASGEKTIESRWYVNRVSPWNKIKKGENIWFKNSGEKVTMKARVNKVIQFDNLTPDKIFRILEMYGKRIGFEENKYKSWAETSTKKNYCVLVFISNPKFVKSFEINKQGFGISTAWISIEDINTIRK